MCIRDRLGTPNEISMLPPLAPAIGLSPFPEGTSASLIPVSYTHLDVYKRQGSLRRYSDSGEEGEEAEIEKLEADKLRRNVPCLPRCV